LAVYLHLSQRVIFMFKFCQKGTITYLASEALNEIPFLTHAFLTRRGDADGRGSNLYFSFRGEDEEEDVLKNWETLSSSFEIPISQFLVVDQVHGDEILAIDGTDSAKLKDEPLFFDAIVSRKPGLAIGIKTADCVPIFLADPKREIVCAIHAGWKGTALGIAAKTIGLIVRKFACRPADLVVAIGPAIGPCCYQVDRIVFDSMKDTPAAKDCFVACDEPGHWMLNLPLANRLQLEEAGVNPDNIHSARLCTACRHDLFFSHRRDGSGTGRQMSFIMIRQAIRRRSGEKELDMRGVCD
jgi:polyphenol oxidase